MPSKFSLMLTAAVIVGLAGSVLAGPLATDGAAYNDGNGPAAGAWRGTTPMVGTGASVGLVADVDWCVYGPGSYPGTAYSPDANEFVYAYQISVGGTVAVTQLTVGMLDSNEANDIGSDATLVDGVETPNPSFFLNPPPNLTEALWVFPGIAVGDDTDALVYSSVNAPLMFGGSIIDGGKFVAGPLPSPSDLIPEPATMSLLALGAIGLIRRKRG